MNPTKRLPKVYMTVLSVVLCTFALGLTKAFGQGWPQWAQNPQHTGFLPVIGQHMDHILANIVYDPNVPDEQAQTGGDLLVHYQTPLVDGNDVYMLSKAGSYTVGTYATQTWHQNKFTWQATNLVKLWTFDSDWVPPGSQMDFWEPVYHAVLANGFLYDPGAGGSIFKLNKSDGTVVTRLIPSQFLNPDGSLNAHTFTVSPLTADSAGNIYYNVLKLHDNGPFYKHDAVNSWLVKVTAADSISIVSYTGLNPAAPNSGDPCISEFDSSQLPFPPSPTAIPPSTPCGLQRVGVNVAPAISADGTIYSVTRAHFFAARGYGFLLAINPDLTLKWATSLRGPDAPGSFPDSYLNGGYFHDGCNDGTAASDGSQLPLNGATDTNGNLLGGCRAGARAGVDPRTNRFGGGVVLDSASSTPTVAPDGSVFYGAYSRYNYAQGHLMHFAANGTYLGSYLFGWDSTVAIYQHSSTYSVVIKENHYDVGSYCNFWAFCPGFRSVTNPASPEVYFVTQLSPNLTVEWKFQNTNTQSCIRNGDGSITCFSDHPNSFEWCVNAPVIDVNGVVYANSEDGNLYAIRQGGILQQRIFQQLAIGAAYTPASLGGDGKIYTQNAGHLFVVGN
jgi:hypothetical protein